MSNDTLTDFVGRYDLTSSDKFDDFLKEMGVGYIKRKLANSVSPTIEIIDNGDGTWTKKILTSVKNSIETFKLGVEFDEHRLDDKTVRTTITRDGNKLIKRQASDPPVEFILEFNGDEMVETCVCNNVKAVRKFKKV